MSFRMVNLICEKVKKKLSISPEASFASRRPANLWVEAERTELIAAFRDRVHVTHSRLLAVPNGVRRIPARHVTRDIFLALN